MDETLQIDGRKTQAPLVTKIWGWAGVLPFAILTGATVYLEPGDEAWAFRVLVAYGAIILTFMGGVHWGLALGGADKIGSSYTVGILPSIAATSAIVVSPGLALTILAFGFLSLLLYDLWLVRSAVLPRWYGQLRIQLTVVVVVLLGLAGLLGVG